MNLSKIFKTTSPNISAEQAIEIAKWSVFILAITSSGIAYALFDVTNRDEVSSPIQDILMFYGRGEFTYTTFGWYSLSLLILWSTWRLVKNKCPKRLEAIVLTGCIAVLLAPSVFVDPTEQPAVANLLAPHIFTALGPSETIILPAWVSIIKFSWQAPYGFYREVAVAVSFWPITVIWSLALIGAMIYDAWQNIRQQERKN